MSTEFFQMGGYAPYVWGSYGLTLGILGANLWFARRLEKQRLQEIKRRLLLTEDTV